MATAGDIISGSLRLIGQLAEGETASAATMQDSLAAMQDMLASWSLERLSVFATQDQVFTWPANTATQTLGPTGSFVGVRPIELDDSTYFVAPGTGVSYGVSIVNEQQYNGIALKGVTSTFPQLVYVSATFPDMTLTIYPVPTTALDWHFVSVSALGSPVGLATGLLFPPGYLRAFRYNLACELAPEFGVEPSAQVQRVAMTAKRNLKRINNPDDLLSMPNGLMVSRRFNIYTGTS